MSKLHVIKYAHLLLLAGLLQLKLVGQNVDLVLEVADQLYEQEDYFGSIQFYKKALDLDSTNEEVLYKYGRNLCQINNNKGGSRYLLKAFIIDRGIRFPNLAFELAEAYRSAGEYRKARKYYGQALRPFRRDKESYWYQRISRSKESANWANKSTKYTATPSNLGKVVNSSFSEFGASLTEDQVYFSAMRADTVFQHNRIGDTHYYSRIYTKSLSDAEVATEVLVDKRYQELIKDKHLANPFLFDKDIYFSICDTNFQCEIWKGRIAKNRISKLEKLNGNINNKNSNNTQAQLVAFEGNQYLFFASDRERGFGGLDIYRSKLEAFGFDEAVNLGAAINTPDNEITPFFDPRNQTLYFSSEWHNGYGGYDIFESTYQEGYFNTAINLGQGINTHFNEYYFQTHDQLATLTSNRIDGNIENSSSCCNDLFQVNFETKTIEVPVDTIVNEEILNKYLPLTLYFHNDMPNPNTFDTNTTAVFSELAADYMEMEATYEEEYLSDLPNKKRDVEAEELMGFFSEELPEGLNDLVAFAPLLLKELEKGNQVELTIRGFASSLSASDYNINLTKRRIQSLINYFLIAENGQFKPYIENTDNIKGKLSFNKLPYGEFAVKEKIDDGNLKEAIYSSAAIRERKIELLAVSSTASNTVVNIEKDAKIKFNSMNYIVGSIPQGDLIERSFFLTNSGEGELKIYNIHANLNQAKVNFPTSIHANEEGEVSFTVNSADLPLGKFEISLMVVSNATQNIQNLKISGEIISN